MATGRMLNRTVARDARLAQLSAHSALLYLMCIPHLDRDGRIDGLPTALRGLAVPYFSEAKPVEWTVDAIAGYVAEWTRTVDQDGSVRPLVLHYQVGEVWACTFTGFAKNQKLRYDREAVSTLPAPPFDLLSQLPRAVADAVVAGVPSPEDDLELAQPDAVPGQLEAIPHEHAGPDLVRTSSGVTPEFLPPKAEAEPEGQREREAEQPEPKLATPGEPALVDLDSVLLEPRLARCREFVRAVAAERDDELLRNDMALIFPGLLTPANVDGLLRLAAAVRAGDDLPDEPVLPAEVDRWIAVNAHQVGAEGARELFESHFRLSGPVLELAVDTHARRRAGHPAAVDGFELVGTAITATVAQTAGVDRLLELIPQEQVNPNTRKQLEEIFSRLPDHDVELAREELLAKHGEIRNPAGYIIQIGRRRLAERERSAA